MLLDRFGHDLGYRSLPFREVSAKFQMVQFRFCRLAEDAKLSCAADLGHERVQVLWKAWQTEYCAAELPDLAPRHRRGAFQKYAHKTIGKIGEHVLRAVLQTGHSASLIRSNFMNKVIDAPSKPIQTCKAKTSTAAQVAKKARRNANWVQNKAAVFARTQNLCERCYGSHGSALRACQQCLFSYCAACLPQDRLCCSSCPAVDLVALGRGAVQLCDKCTWHCQEGTVQCEDCRLWLCDWCVDGGSKRCRRKCPKHASLASGRQSMSLAVHPRAPSIFDQARDGGVSRRAVTLSAQVDLRRSTSSTSYGRLLMNL